MKTPLCIPPDLIRDRLIPLLDLESCVRLDSAVLNKSLRTNWLEGLTQALLLDPHVSVQNDGLSWIREKQLRPLHVEMQGNVSDAIAMESCDDVFSELTTLFVNGCQNITDAAVALIIERSTKLRALKFDHCYRIMHFQLRNSGSRTLKELHFVDCTTLDESTFTSLVVNCPNLEVINISGCDRLTDTSVLEMSSSCTKLREFQFRIYGNMTMQSVHYLAQKCSNLRKIVDTSVLEAATITSEHLDHRYSDVLVDLAKQCPLLEHVELQAPFIMDHQLKLFAHNCPHLHTFNIGLNEFLFGDGVENLVVNCTSLTHLNLANMINLSEAVLLTIAEYCTTLTTLHLPRGMDFGGDLLCDIWRVNPGLQTLGLTSYLTDEAQILDVTLVNTASLTHLNISNNYIAETSLLTLFAQSPALRHLDMSCTTNASSAPVLECLGRFCPLLHTLILSQSHRHDYPPPALTALAEYCTSLTTLTLAGTHDTEEGIYAIIAQNPKLEFLDLSWCSQMTDYTIHTLSKSCAHLHTLKLKDTTISDAAFCALAKRCRRLRKVYLDCCGFVTLKCITQLARNNRKLEYLSVTQSENKLTDTVFCVLSQHCPFLRTLALLGCGKMSDSAVSEMVSKYNGQLKILV